MSMRTEQAEMELKQWREAFWDESRGNSEYCKLVSTPSGARKMMDQLMADITESNERIRDLQKQVLDAEQREAYDLTSGFIIVLDALNDNTDAVQCFHAIVAAAQNSGYNKGFQDGKASNQKE